MAELLSKEMLADLVINIANIVILFLVTRALVYKPVKKYLSERKEKLAAERENAAALLAEANAKQAKYESLLAEADAEKARLLAEAEAEAHARADEIVAEADAAARQTAAEAKAEAALEKQQALDEAKTEIGELAVALSGKIMGRAAGDRDDLRAAKAFFEGGTV